VVSHLRRVCKELINVFVGGTCTVEEKGKKKGSAITRRGGKNTIQPTTRGDEGGRLDFCGGPSSFLEKEEG